MKLGSWFLSWVGRPPPKRLKMPWSGTQRSSGYEIWSTCVTRVDRDKSRRKSPTLDSFRSFAKSFTTVEPLVLHLGHFSVLSSHVGRLRTRLPERKTPPSQHHEVQNAWLKFGGCICHEEARKFTPTVVRSAQSTALETFGPRNSRRSAMNSSRPSAAIGWVHEGTKKESPTDGSWNRGFNLARSGKLRLGDETLAADPCFVF